MGWEEGLLGFLGGAANTAKNGLEQDIQERALADREQLRQDMAMKLAEWNRQQDLAQRDKIADQEKQRTIDDANDPVLVAAKAQKIADDAQAAASALAATAVVRGGAKLAEENAANPNAQAMRDAELDYKKNSARLAGTSADFNEEKSKMLDWKKSNPAGSDKLDAKISEDISKAGSAYIARLGKSPIFSPYAGDIEGALSSIPTSAIDSPDQLTRAYSTVAAQYLQGAAKLRQDIKSTIAKAADDDLKADKAAGWFSSGAKVDRESRIAPLVAGAMKDGMGMDTIVKVLSDAGLSDDDANTKLISVAQQLSSDNNKPLPSYFNLSRMFPTNIAPDQPPGPQVVGTNTADTGMFSGDSNKIRAEIMRIPNPTDRAAALAQLDRQLSGGTNAPTPTGPRLAPDGNYYVPDPARPGKYLKVGG